MRGAGVVQAQRMRMAVLYRGREEALLETSRYAQAMSRLLRERRRWRGVVVALSLAVLACGVVIVRLVFQP